MGQEVRREERHDMSDKAKDERRARELNEFAAHCYAGGGFNDRVDADKRTAKAFQEVRAERDAELLRPETVERVARAIHAECNRQVEECAPGHVGTSWDDLAEWQRDDYREQAKAALAALEEK